MSDLVLPNFFIVGAARAATSSLWFYLSEHPEIFMSPNKEAQFFGFFDTDRKHKAKYKTLEEYSRLFDGVTNEKVIGEATPTYLALPESAHSIRKHCPNAKILISLRNPIDRMFSYYEMSLSKGRDKNISFEDWIQSNKFWLESSHYADNLNRYFRLFDREKIKIILYDDIANKTEDILGEIHRFLGVEVIRPESKPYAYNQGGRSNTFFGDLLYKSTTNRYLNKVLRPIMPRSVKDIIHRLRSSSMKKGIVNPETRENLCEYFSKDIASTEKIISRDLSHWINADD